MRKKSIITDFIQTHSMYTIIKYQDFYKKKLIFRRKSREWLPKSPKPEAHVKTFNSN